MKFMQLFWLTFSFIVMIQIQGSDQETKNEEIKLNATIQDLYKNTDQLHKVNLAWLRGFYLLTSFDLLSSETVSTRIPKIVKLQRQAYEIQRRLKATPLIIDEEEGYLKYMQIFNEYAKNENNISQLKYEVELDCMCTQVCRNLGITDTEFKRRSARIFGPNHIFTSLKR